MKTSGTREEKLARLKKLQNLHAKNIELKKKLDILNEEQEAIRRQCNLIADECKEEK